MRFLGWTVAMAVSAAIVGFAGATYLRSQTETDDHLSAVRFALGGTAGNEVNRFSSLPEMAARADAIVEGRVVRVEPGREFAGPPRAYYVTAYVQVSEGLKDGSGSDKLAVEFFVGDGEGSEEFIAALKGFHGIWFLLDKYEEARRLGLSGDLVEREAGYYMLASSQGLVAEDSDEAVNVFGSRETDTIALIDATDGVPYAALKANVDQLAESKP